MIIVPFKTLQALITNSVNANYRSLKPLIKKPYVGTMRQRCAYLLTQWLGLVGHAYITTDWIHVL